QGELFIHAPVVLQESRGVTALRRNRIQAVDLAAGYGAEQERGETEACCRARLHCIRSLGKAARKGKRAGGIVQLPFVEMQPTILAAELEAVPAAQVAEAAAGCIGVARLELQEVVRSPIRRADHVADIEGGEL